MIPYLLDKDFDLVKLYESGDLPVFDADNKQIYVRDPHPSVPERVGIGVLAETTECIAKSVLNGEDEITLKYPADGQLFDKIEVRGIVIAKPDKFRNPQPYRIYRITKTIKGMITIYARHVVYDLGGIIAKPYKVHNLADALKGLKDNAMTSCQFTFATNMNIDRDFEVTIPTPIWDLLGSKTGSLLDIYGGEYSFDGYDIQLKDRIGANRGVSIRYGVNMTDFEQDANCASCYTGVVGYWSGTDNQVVHTNVIAAPGTYGYTKIMTVDFSRDFDEAPTIEQLNELVQLYIENNNIGIPDVSWKINFVPLDQTVEYSVENITDARIRGIFFEGVSLGDDVKVIFEKYNVNATARVISVEWNVLRDRYNDVELGSVKSNLANTIATQTKEIAAVPTADDVTKIASVVASGIVAEWIQTGKISADRIEGGTLQLGKELNESGRIDIFNAANEYIGALYNAGMWWGSGIYSSLQNQNGFSIRKRYSDDGSTQNLVFIGRTTRDETTGMDYGILHMASVDDSGNRVINAYINGDGTISCKRLFVNGHEIT